MEKETDREDGKADACRGIVISEKEFDEGIGEKEKGEEEGKCRDKNPFGDH